MRIYFQSDAVLICYFELQLTSRSIAHESDGVLIANLPRDIGGCLFKRVFLASDRDEESLSTGPFGQFMEGFRVDPFLVASGKEGSDRH